MKRRTSRTVSNQVIEHLDGVDKFVDEIHRMLKDDGRVFLMTINLTSAHNILLMMFGMQPTGFHVSKIQIGNPLRGVETCGHKKAFTLLGLKHLFEYHKFHVNKTLGYGFYFLPKLFGGILSRIMPQYSVYIGIIAEKQD